MKIKKICYNYIRKIKKINELISIFIISLLIISATIATNASGQKNFDSFESYDTRGDRNSSGIWNSYRLWSESAEINAIAVGDVDADFAGDEIVVAGNSNKVTVIYNLDRTVSSKTVFTDYWRVTAVAIGDVYPNNPGNEIVVVGWSTNVTLIYKSNETGEWISHELYDDYDWLYGVTIGDIDPGHKGNEILSVGDPRHVLMLYFSEPSNSWEARFIWNNTPDINVVGIGDVDPYHKGNEAIVTGVNVEELKLREIWYNESQEIWNIATVGDIGKDPINMVIGDFYSKNTGEEIAIVSIQRHVLMVYKDDNGSWVMEKIWRDTESIRDIELGDVASEYPGDELILVGLSDNLTILWEDENTSTGWNSNVIYSASSDMIGVAFGDFDGLHNGSEIAIIQRVGKVIKLQFERPEYSMYSPQNRYYSLPNREIQIPVVINYEGGFTESIYLEILNSTALSNVGIDVKMDTEIVNDTQMIYLNITASKITTGSHTIVLSGKTNSNENLKKRLYLILDVLNEGRPFFNFTITPEISEVLPDYSVSNIISLTKINSGPQNMEFEIVTLPLGASYSIEQRKVPNQNSYYLNITTTSATPKGSYPLVVRGIGHMDDNDDIIITKIFKLIVQSPKPDYYLEADRIDLESRINDTITINMTLFSILGFDEPVDFSVVGLPEDITTEFQPTSVIPTGNASLNLIIGHRTEIGEYSGKIIAKSQVSNTVHELEFKLNILPEPSWFEIILEPDEKLSVPVDVNGELKVIIQPYAGYSGTVNITISELPAGAGWQSDTSPIIVTKRTTILIVISGLDKVGNYRILVGAEGVDYSTSKELDLEIFEKEKDSNGENSITTELIYIILLVLVLVVIMVIYSLITNRYRTDGKKKKK